MRAVAAGVAVAALAAAALAGTAAAHPRLVATTPAAGAELATAPPKVVVQLTEAAAPVGDGIRVTGPDGSEVARGPVVVAGGTLTRSIAARDARHLRGRVARRRRRHASRPWLVPVQCRQAHRGDPPGSRRRRSGHRGRRALALARRVRPRFRRRLRGASLRRDDREVVAARDGGRDPHDRGGARRAARPDGHACPGSRARACFRRGRAAHELRASRRASPRCGARALGPRRRSAPGIAPFPVVDPARRCRGCARLRGVGPPHRWLCPLRSRSCSSRHMVRPSAPGSAASWSPPPNLAARSSPGRL